MVKILGRLVARENSVGIYIPFNGNNLDGLYEVKEVEGEIVITKIGDPALSSKKFYNLDANGIFKNRPESCMTKEELGRA